MKLISMTDFILSNEVITLDESTFMRVIEYARFLKQPLQLWMFVPCDEEGNVLEKPKFHYTKEVLKYLHIGVELNTALEINKEVARYIQAKERCFFKGFTNSDEKEKSFVFTVNGVGGYWISKDDTIEGLMSNFIPDYIELTETAIKQFNF